MKYEAPELFEVGNATELVLSNQFGSNCDCGGKKAAVYDDSYQIETTDEEM